MVSLGHTVLLMLSCFHPRILCSYSFQKWSRNQTLMAAALSGRCERTHHPHHLALAERNDGTTCCIPWHHSGNSYIQANILQPGVAEDVPVHGRGVGTRRSLRSLPTQTILWFYELCHAARQCHRPLWPFLSLQVKLPPHFVCCLLRVSSHGI